LSVPSKNMSPRLTLLRGKAYYYKNEDKLAKIEFEKTLANNPTWRSYLFLGFIEQGNKNMINKKALEHYKTAYKMNPNEQSTVIPLLKWCLNNYDFKKALEYQILLRDLVIDEFVEVYNSEELDSEEIDALYEPDLLEAE